MASDEDVTAPKTPIAMTSKTTMEIPIVTTKLTCLIPSICIPTIIMAYPSFPHPLTTPISTHGPVPPNLLFYQKNKLGFIDRTLIHPNSTYSKYLAWDCCNNMVMVWFINLIEKEISKSFLWLDFTKDMLEKLHERCHQGDIFHISYLQEEIYAQKQGKQTITQYFSSLKKLWKKFNSFCPIPSCTCEPI